MESVATMRTIIDAAEGWMERNPVMMEKRIMRNIERVRWAYIIYVHVSRPSACCFSSTTD